MTPANGPPAACTDSESRGKKKKLGRKESPRNVRYVLFWRKINYFRVRLKFLLFDLRPEGFRN